MKRTSNKEFLQSLDSEEYKNAIVSATKQIMDNHANSDYAQEVDESLKCTKVFDEAGSQILGITNKVFDITLADKKRYCSIFPNVNDKKDLVLLSSTYNEFVEVKDFGKRMFLGRKNSNRFCPMKLITVKLNMTVWGKSIKEPKKVINSIQIAEPKKMNLMDLNKAKRIFFKNYLQPLFRREGKEFVVDEHNKKVLDMLMRYFTRNESELDINKGVLIWGKTGSGKSSIMYALSKFTKDFNLDTKFEFVKMENLHDTATSEGVGFVNKYKAKDICIDEFAAKRYMDAYFYKQHIQVFSSLIEKRWSRYSLIHNQITHATSNINFTPAVELMLNSECGSYDGMDRELSRIKGMFNFVKLSGLDRRIN